MTQFTTSQQAAITHDGHDVLVSASAGSGKPPCWLSELFKRFSNSMPTLPGC